MLMRQTHRPYIGDTSLRVTVLNRESLKRSAFDNTPLGEIESYPNFNRTHGKFPRITEN